MRWLAALIGVILGGAIGVALGVAIPLIGFSRMGDMGPLAGAMLAFLTGPLGGIVGAVIGGFAGALIAARLRTARLEEENRRLREGVRDSDSGHRRRV